MVSANIPSNLLSTEKEVLSPNNKKLTLKKLKFTCVAKLLATTIQITFEHSTEILEYCS